MSLGIEALQDEAASLRDKIMSLRAVHCGAPSPRVKTRDFWHSAPWLQCIKPPPFPDT